MNVDQYVQPLPMRIDSSLDSLHRRYVVGPFSTHALKVDESATRIVEPPVECMDLVRESEYVSAQPPKDIKRNIPPHVVPVESGGLGIDPSTTLLGLKLHVAGLVGCEYFRTEELKARG
jgi:hypothetical protein